MSWQPVLCRMHIQRNADQDVEREGEPQRHAEVERGVGLGNGMANDRRHSDVRRTGRQYHQQSPIAH